MTEKIPEGWKKSTLVQLYKGKGSSSDLTNYRNIHTKSDVRKLFGEIITYEIKSRAIENVSKFQIGALPGHHAQEHIFTMKSGISYY